MQKHLAAIAVSGLLTGPFAMAHETAGGKSVEVTTSVPLPFEVEKKAPVTGLKMFMAGPNTKISGQGAWKFVPAPKLTPVPPEALPKLKGAHGTIIVDSERDLVYWGLENVGWIGFSNKLANSWIIKGDPAFAHGNLHGADIFPRKGQLPLVVVADNNDGEVYLTDTSFEHATTLHTPEGGPYSDKKGFAPTDATFVSKDEIWVTDGYGKAWFMPASANPFAYRGEFYGGKSVSQTPHGITYDAHTDTLLVSARPEAQVKRFDLHHHHFTDIAGLPPGSTVCDVDLWGDYAIAPCLDGPKGAPGPIYIINLKKRVIVSTIKPKEDLGYTEAQHIHDAAWYVTGTGSKKEVYILFTNWNPGGVGALRLVDFPD
ncbi:MAG TPA: hypothetical protein VMF06_06190 [Candidatus Limnocylindria bacterium]|nr:hypothetical protein [Candidatus Limnocylindria bacterium]